MADQIDALVAEALKLPRWAVVALAARCARRVLPAYFQGDVATEYFALNIYYAVWAAQEAAARGQPPPKPPQGVKLSSLTGWPSNSPSGGAVKSAALAFKIARAAGAAGADPSKELKGLLSLMPRIARKHPSALQAVRRDLALLAAVARKQKWSDSSPVPETVFGPLWVEEAPPGWPIDAPGLDPAGWRDWQSGAHPTVPRMDTRWVHTAFAVRCTHRVLPLLYQCPHDRFVAMHAEAVWLAAQLAATPGSVKLRQAVKQAGRKLAREMHKIPDGLPNHIAYSLGAARMTVWLAEESLLRKPPNNARSSAETTEHTRAAADSLGVKLQQIEDRDWDQVLRWAVANSIQANTGVPQSVFGPLWEKAPPAVWPEPAEIGLEAFRTVSTRKKAPAVPEVEVLPRWAVAAFSARVLQRATPWMAHKFPAYVGKAQVKAVQKYLRTFEAVLEQTNPSAAALDRLLEENRAIVTTLADKLALGDPDEVVGFATAIHDLDRFLHPVLCAKKPKDGDIARALAALKQFADDTDGTKGILGFSRLTSDELTRMKERAAAEKWTNQTAVPLASCGPLWPRGEPKWWPG